MDNLLSLEVDIDHVRAHCVRNSEVRWESSKYEGAGREIGECGDKERHAGAAIRNVAFGPVRHCSSGLKPGLGFLRTLGANADAVPCTSESLSCRTPISLLFYLCPPNLTRANPTAVQWSCIPHHAEANYPVLSSPGRRETGCYEESALPTLSHSTMDSDVAS